MSNYTRLLDSAGVALAGYASLNSGDTNSEPNIQALTQAGMSQNKAEEFAKRYVQVLLPAYHDSGLDLTVFKSAEGDVVLGLRGTLGLDDVLGGAESIAEYGAAFQQIVALANWWLLVGSPAGTPVAQYRLKPFTDFEVEQWTTIAATGEVAAELAFDPDGKIDVVGHSLGGHLAMAFNALFGTASGVDQVGSVYAFNAPGFLDNTTTQDFFALLGGAVPTQANSANVVNVIANEAAIGMTSFQPIAGRNSRPGQGFDIAIENQFQTDEPYPDSPAYNHSMAILTDSLAVYELLTRIDPTLTPGAYQGILHQAAMGTAASLEHIVDALQKLLGVDDVDLPVGNDQRDALYSAIYALQEHPGFQVVAGATIGASPAAQQAKEDFGALLALAFLSPLCIEDRSTQLGEAHTDLYAKWQADRALTPEQRGAGQANFSDEWLTDRAGMLEALLVKQTLDTNRPVAVGSESGVVDYIDRASGERVRVAAQGTPTQDLIGQRQVVFGGVDVYRWNKGDGEDYVIDFAGDGLGGRTNWQITRNLRHFILTNHRVGAVDQPMV